MNPLAEELNSILDRTSAGRLLSDFGRRIYFPKGIIAQSAEAKKDAKTANATIGMAYHNGKPMMLSALGECINALKAEEIVSYAPTAGFEEARTLWKEAILAKNPSLQEKNISLPVVVPGITAGISYTADLFLGAGQTIIANDPSWDNYSLIFETRRGASIRGVPFFAGDGLDLEAIRTAVREEAKSGAVRIILNFPNNPAGYSPSVEEAAALCECLREAAESGAAVLALCDDAYFGLRYEEGSFPESLFAVLSGLHERIIAVKADGPTKEDYVWGLRVAFLTFGSKGLAAEDFAALIQKLEGAIRSSVSCSNTPAQFLLKKTSADPRSAGEKVRNYELLRARYRAVKQFVAAHEDFMPLRSLPFNSGYFMSFACVGFDAETLRRELLARHGIGVVALGGSYIRLAYSSLDEEQIAPVLETIFNTAAALGA
ncbi:MAG: aminotransferase class I/II-fold pyridoxal phosphate-dependent enzyme [Spirochaetaceae bacterium]|jgi:aspartate/methionine/tyrosine aminotransferase|nr:aminotransferase class I/II-fold pyridoxal phosphate-dependent enzyme [Spirochaetaceae bacterium]